LPVVCETWYVLQSEGHELGTFGFKTLRKICKPEKDMEIINKAH